MQRRDVEGPDVWEPRARSPGPLTRYVAVSRLQGGIGGEIQGAKAQAVAPRGSKPDRHNGSQPAGQVDQSAAGERPREAEPLRV